MTKLVEKMAGVFLNQSMGEQSHDDDESEERNTLKKLIRTFVKDNQTA